MGRYYVNGRECGPDGGPVWSLFGWISGRIALEKRHLALTQSADNLGTQVRMLKEKNAELNKLLGYLGFTEKAAEEKMLKELGRGWVFQLSASIYSGDSRLFLLGPAGYSAQGNDKLALLSEALAQREKAKAFCPEIGKK